MQLPPALRILFAMLSHTQVCSSAAMRASPPLRAVSMAGKKARRTALSAKVAVSTRAMASMSDGMASRMWTGFELEVAIVRCSWIACALLIQR